METPYGANLPQQKDAAQQQGGIYYGILF